MDGVVKVDDLKRAIRFLDLCRAEKTSAETGALRDAHEWVESAARAVVADSEKDDHITAYYNDKATTGQPPPVPRC
jgi:hypothetical protein